VGTAGTIENVQNYMDYSYCSVMFTKGQKDRMRTALETNVSGRNNLWTTANLNATGTNNNGSLCKPIADFYSTDLALVCPNDIVSFKSSIRNVTPGSPLTLLWEFEDGTPATSSAINPTIKYTTPGYHTVKLTATNSAGSSSVERWGYVYVRVADGEHYILGSQLSEGFEDTAAVAYSWHMFDFNANYYTWQNAKVGYNSGHSLRMNAFMNTPSDIDVFVTPSFNLYMLTDLKLSFKYTAGTRATIAADMNDALTIYYSFNCGSTWLTSPLLTLKGSDLTSSGGNQPTYYTPTSAAQWKSQEMKIPIYNPANNKVILKFEYKTGSKSNNVYIDDINLSGTVGIDENEISASRMTIYPNPTNDLTKVSYHLNHSAAVTLELMDILGKQLTKIDQHEQAEGDFAIDLSKEQLKLKAGIYFIKLTVGKTSVTNKLVVTE